MEAFKKKIEEKKKKWKKNQSSEVKNEKPNKEKLKSVYQDLLSDFKIAKRFKNKNFSNYDPSHLENDKNIFSEIKDYGNNFYKHSKTGDFLVLTGGYGLGKTHLAIAVGKQCLKFFARDYLKKNRFARRYLSPSKNTIKLVKSIDMMEDLTSCYNNKNKDEQLVKQNYINTKLLILDDLGKEHFNNDYLHKVYYSILDKRYEEQRNTIITTNLNTKELKDHIGGAVIDRIIEAAGNGKFLFELKGKSYRRKKSNVSNLG